MDELELTIESHEETHFTEIADEESKKRNEIDKEISEKIWKEIDNNLTFLLVINFEDFYGIKLDDAINDKLHSPNTE